MPRCTSTMKFASYDEPEAEWYSDPDVSDHTIEAVIRIVRPCAECGEEMAEIELDVSADFDPCPFEAEDKPCDYELDADDPEPFDESGPTTKTLKNGKVVPINPRYVKTFYGAEAEVRITCSKHPVGAGPAEEVPEETWEGTSVTLRDRAQASHFEILVD